MMELNLFENAPLHDSGEIGDIHNIDLIFLNILTIIPTYLFKN